MSAIQITQENFEQEVLRSESPVLVDFWAPWCSPCRMLSPVIDEIADERSDVRVCKINVDQESGLAEQFQVMSVPTLMVFKQGQLVRREVGAQPKANILQLL